ncbi:MAG: hypothetical protein Q9157_008751 [Trypethelium eluteriae]
MSESQTVAYLGPKASYTHQTSIEDVFIAVQARTSAIGVVPFENSTNGPVFFTLDLFADRHRRFPDIKVCGEAFVDVHHCLLGRIRSAPVDGNLATLRSSTSSPSTSGTTTPTAYIPLPKKPLTKPLHNISHVRKLYSHPQAWGQCNAFLSTYLRQTERQDCSSTSRAADIVSIDSNAEGEEAAIACELAAKVYSLDILARGIEDERGNRTRFLILRHSDSDDTNLDTKALAHIPNAAVFKTLVSFTVAHTSPGALADSLGVFGKYGLNLTSISSRPSGMAAWHYIFFVEVLGTTSDKKEGKGAIDAALRDLDKVASSWRCLGSWEVKEEGMEVVERPTNP